MNRIKTKLDIIYNDNVKKDIVIVHISDIHFNINIKSKKLKKLSNYINNIKADYIMITGDILDDARIINNKKKIKELVVFLSDIARNCRVFISLGNHDIFDEDDFAFFNKLNDLYNIYVLNNSSYQDEKIYVSGFTLPTEYYYNIIGDESSKVLFRTLDKNNQMLSKLPKNLPKIGLIHSPIKLADSEIINKFKEYDLILSGHTHGGMVPAWLGHVFKNYGIVSPQKKIFQNMMRGRVDRDYNDKKLTIIINDAITRLGRYPIGIFSKFNFIYNSSINKIIIRKK